LEVRRARPADAAAIAEVHVRTWQAAYEHVFGAEQLARITPKQRLPMWKNILGASEVTAFVAADDGVVVGIATVGPSRDEDAQGEVYAIYVEPKAWGSGAGPALMRACVAALKAGGHPDAILWVLEDNPRARRFYEREGWSLDGERREGEHLGVQTAEIRYSIEL
jgi:GNAT superfamily N-acetyltransferase